LSRLVRLATLDPPYGYVKGLSLSVRRPNGLIVKMSTRRPEDPWPFVHTLFEYDEVDSTSNRAADLAIAGSVSFPFAVWARHQTAGRGRGNHVWWSDAGSLTFTLALDPAAHGLSAESEPLLSLATGVAIIAALDELHLGDPSLGIRWPNDLEIHGRKLGGILPERVETANGRRILVGVGLNVSTDLTRAPDDVRAMATTLAQAHGGLLPATLLPTLLSAILRQIESALPRLATRDPALAAAWDRMDLLRDQWVTLDLGGGTITGHACGISSAGALCVNDGRVVTRLFGGQVLRPSIPEGSTQVARASSPCRQYDGQDAGATNAR
jgi:BirA family biotin operon repressor/biotin-[acetyl-CoA-carboxylase] ligase